MRIVKEQLNVRMNVSFAEKHIELMGPISIGKIRAFQERVFGWQEEYSGLIEPNDKTWKALVSSEPLEAPQPIGLDGDEIYLKSTGRYHCTKKK